MRRQTNLSATEAASFSRLRLYSLLHNYSERGIWPALRRMVALAMALLLLPAWQGELLAQQAPPTQLGQAQQDYSGQLQSDGSSYGAQPYQAVDAYPQQGNAQVQPLNAVRLEQLVAPIALYPDTLVALVLTASTYPAQVVEADRWRQMQGDASADQIAAGADAQNWDPSVKALTAFPQVLAQMDQNLPWTSDLGNAYYNQSSDVLEAVQVLRQRAQAAGNLQATPYEAVNYVAGDIQLAPVNPQVLYVPAYDPWSVYGQPVSPYPGFSLIGALGSFFGSAPVSYGLGIAMSAFTRMPWGWLAWGLSWLAQAVLFHNSNYYSHSATVADWGFPHGGLRAGSGQGGFAGGSNSYRGFGSGYGSTLGQGYVHRPPNSYGYSGGGYNTSRAQAFVHRPPNSAQGFIHRPPNSYERPGGGYNASAGRGFVPRAPNSYSGYRSAQNSSRGYQSSGFGYARGPQLAYNHTSSTVSRSPLANRATTARPQRSNFAQRSSYEYGSRGFAQSPGKQARARSYHPFSGGRGAESFHGGGHAPRIKAPKSYSGGHSGGSGHSGGHSSGKHHH